MSSISNPLQLRADRPLEPERHVTLAALNVILKSLQCSYMLVGATARDILLYNVFGQSIRTKSLWFTTTGTCVAKHKRSKSIEASGRSALPCCWNKRKYRS